MNDRETLFHIADRAKFLLRLPVDRITLVIDIDSACEQFSFEPSDLLNADDETFAHDVGGIVGHMDRGSYPGTVGDCFVPRVAN
jgi:hypothetical protein